MARANIKKPFAYYIMIYSYNENIRFVVCISYVLTLKIITLGGVSRKKHNAAGVSLFT